MTKFLIDADDEQYVFDTETAEYLGRLTALSDGPEFYRLGDRLIEIYTPPMLGTPRAHFTDVETIVDQAISQMKMGGSVDYELELIERVNGTPPPTLTA